MNGRAVRVAWYRLRGGHGRRWAVYLSLVLIIGLIGGVALAAVAGARRTESSFPTYEASTHPSTIGLFTRYDDPGLKITTGYDARLQRIVARLPLVERSASAVIFDGNIYLPSIKGTHPHVAAGESPPTFIGSFDGEFTVLDRLTVIAGRMPDPTRRDEAVMNAGAASELGLHLGSVIHIPFYTDAATNAATNVSSLGKPFLVASVRMVGEVVASTDVIQSDIDSLGSTTVIFSPALTRYLAPKCATGTETLLLLKGGTGNAKRVLAEAYRVDPVAKYFPAQITSSFVPSVQATIGPDALALAVFGGLAGLSLLLIAGLMIERLIRVGSDETSTVRALGADRVTMSFDHLLGVFIALAVGSLVAVVVAVALSPLTPLGPVRPVFPGAGVAFDWTVLGLGVMALLIVLASLSVFLDRREIKAVSSRRASRAWRPESRIVRSIATAGLPVSAVAGVRFALDPGRGRSATPVRSALAGAVLAITVLVSTVTFGASLNALVSRPSLYGWNWNYALLSGFGGAEDLPGPQVARYLNHDLLIEAWSGTYTADAKIDGQNVDFLVEQPGAAVAPPILEGHGVAAANEIVLGGATLARLHKRVGDSVVFSNGATKSTKLRIVGVATMPAVAGDIGMGDGAWVATSDFPTALLNLQNSSIPGPQAIFIRIRAGVSRAAAYRSLRKVNAEVNGGGVVSLLRPIQIVNFRSMGTTPMVFAAGLAAGALVALGLTVAASVRRRRRELALFKALGMTRRQLAAAISWQATVAAVVGVVIGVPLGVAIGRQLWITFAHSIDAVPVPAVPVLSLVVVCVGAVVFANLVAALPGRSASRTPVALVLRTE